MQSVKYLFVAAIIFASCRGSKQTASLPADVNHLPIAYAVSPKALPTELGTPQAEIETESGITKDEAGLPEQASESEAGILSKTTTKKANSFAQLKEMAANCEVKMTKRDVKVLNKLEKKYKGNFDQFRADTFEFTTKAKIIAGVGAVGLLLAIFTGSWFGAFLFILAALGFVLRFLKVIEF